MDDSPYLQISTPSARPVAEEALPPRGGPNQSVVQSVPVSLEVMRALGEAIGNGDLLPNTQQKLEAQVERRALLIASTYDNKWGLRVPGCRFFDALPSTPNDVLRIYNMLTSTKRGRERYDPGNIRILVSGIGDSSSEPTKENIMASLEWLVRSAQPGDYRYFHFSGHGDVIESKEGEGKAARIIPTSPKGVNVNDTEIFSQDSSSQRHTNERISEQKIALKDLKYYNEAILTSWKWTMKLGWDFWKIYDLYRIRDRELNEMFAKLPQGATLTCTLDCCHSGRMISNNHKLAGDGFRGGWDSSIGEDGASESTENATHPTEDSTVTGGAPGKRGGPAEISDAPGSSDASAAPNAGAAEPTGTLRGPVTQKLSAAAQVLGSISGKANWFSPPILDVNTEATTNVGAAEKDEPGMITMVETLPDQEKILDQIKAKMLTWSAAQQRQLAIDYQTERGGYFTNAFTRAVESAEANITVKALHKLVNDTLKNDITRSGEHHLQYCQVWTSLGEGDAAEADKQLDKPFVV